jgi:thiamine biosynthesis lipoprotein
VTDALTHTFAVMGTVVSFRVVGAGVSRDPGAWQRVERAAAWFEDVEAACSRFEPESELRRLCNAPGRRVVASALLYPVVDYALRVAEASGGAFDPTVGGRMESLGFDRSWRTGRSSPSALGHPASSVCYRDVLLDPAQRTIELTRPLLLDLGAVAKGFAVDMAVRELHPLEDFLIDAGGDVYVRGRNEHGRLWSVGIRHPRSEREVVETLSLTDGAVCTSGDYQRRASADVHHILDPGTGASASSVASVTVVAPSAMAADALATAALVLGPARGAELLEREGVEGLFITPHLTRVATRGWEAWRARADAPQGAHPPLP